MRLRVIQGGASLRADHLGRVLAAKYAERSEVPVKWESVRPYRLTWREVVVILPYGILAGLIAAWWF